MAPHPVPTLSRRAVIEADHALGTPTLAPVLIQSRYPLAIGAQRAPDPPRQGDTPARPSRMPIFVPLALRAWAAVSFQSNYVRLDAPAPKAAMPRGKQLPWRPGGNIERRAPDPYGSQFTLYPSGERGQLAAGMP